LLGARKHALSGGEYWSHLANTIELSMCGSDAAYCQITLLLWTFVSADI